MEAQCFFAVLALKMDEETPYSFGGTYRTSVLSEQTVRVGERSCLQDGARQIAVDENLVPLRSIRSESVPKKDYEFRRTPLAKASHQKNMNFLE